MQTVPCTDQVERQMNRSISLGNFLRYLSMFDTYYLLHKTVVTTLRALRLTILKSEE